MKLSTGLFVLGAAVGAWAALSPRRKRMDFRGKVVLVTGGSRGLGLATSKEFAQRGATVAICARDRRELNRAKLQIDPLGDNAHAFVCDIREPAAVEELIGSVTERCGPIDVLINNAGIIKVGPFSDLAKEDFHQAMDVMFWGSLNTTLAVLPSMRARKTGSIVNITSVGGKVSLPHLLPYSCAKFALVALSEGLRTELKSDGITVTTIVPGLMRTGSHLNAEFKGDHAGEYKWFAAGAASPLVSISASRAARAIADATEFGYSETVLSAPAQMLTWMQGVSPQLTAQILTFANSLLPVATGSGFTRRGKELEADIDSMLWKATTAMGQNAAGALNEL